MNDPYAEKNGVLKNKLGIRSGLELEKAEADIAFVKLINVDTVESEVFDIELLKRIHQHIFGDIYEWAGKLRTVPLYKTELIIPWVSVPYSRPERVEKDLEARLTELNSMTWESLSTEEIAFKFARQIALIWRVHPFREGNTRSILSFAYLYAKKHGFPMDMKTFTEGLNRVYEGGQVKNYCIRDFFVIACLDEKDYPEVEPLAKVFLAAMNKYKEDHPTLGSK